MAIPYNRIGRTGFFDHHRMIEDLRHTFGHIATAQHLADRPPASMLTRLGQDLLNATPGDQGAYDLRYAAVDVGFFSKIEYGKAFFGKLPFDCLQAAIVFGRVDLRTKFMGDDGFDFDKALRWYVLHGVREHGLWHTASPEFIQCLRTPSIPVRNDYVSPLCFMIIGERPELSKHFMVHESERIEDVFVGWLREHGLSEYGIAWLASRAEQRRLAIRIKQQCRDRDTGHEDDKTPYSIASRSDIEGAVSKFNAVLQVERVRPLVFTKSQDGLENLVVKGRVGDIGRLGIPLFSPVIHIGMPEPGLNFNFFALQVSVYESVPGGRVQISVGEKILADEAISRVDTIFYLPIFDGVKSHPELSSIEICYRPEAYVDTAVQWGYLRRVWFF